jgi:hypothetical protein
MSINFVGRSAIKETNTQTLHLSVPQYSIKWTGWQQVGEVIAL